MMPTARFVYHRASGRALLLVLALAAAPPALAQRGPQELPPTDVAGQRPDMPARPEEPARPEPPPERPLPFESSGRGLPASNAIGAPVSASQGFFTQADILNQPLLRNNEFLEQLPGLIVTNEVSGVDANVFFLRGFNLEHGTDFAFFVDGIPINLGSNPHGQGFTDLQFIIPELISAVDFGKGPYYAKVGNFSSAGFLNIQYFDALPFGFAKVEAGKYDWFRTVAADSGRVGPGTLLYGVQFNYFNDIYSVPSHLNKTSAVFRYTIQEADDRLSLSAYLYNGQATSAPLMPLRLTWRGVDRFTNLSPSDFAVVNRFMLNGQWEHRWGNGALTTANVYGYRYTFNLFANQTGFLENPDEGDQIQEIDRRWVTGVNLAHSWNSRLFGDQSRHTLGVQVRHDAAPTIRVNHTAERQFLDTEALADIDQTDTGIYYQNEFEWSPKVRTVAGLRGDIYSVNVNNHLIPENSGSDTSSLLLPKGSLILGPWNDTQFFFNGGYSFRSNNAAGVTARVDADGNPVAPLPLLVQSRGAEIGVRTQRIPRLTTSVALWQLHLQQELEFDFATNTTEPLRASDRYGIEWTNTYRLCDWLNLNADYTWSHGRLLGTDPEVSGNYIPQAVTTTFVAGPSVNLPSGFFANLRYRYWGPRPLLQDNSASSKATNLFELSTGYQCRRYTVNFQFLNLLDSSGHNIDAFEESFYPNFGDTEPVGDILFKPLQPFSLVFSFTVRW